MGHGNALTPNEKGLSESINTELIPIGSISKDLHYSTMAVATFFAGTMPEKQSVNEKVNRSWGSTIIFSLIVRTILGIIQRGRFLMS